jgi:hypothetical protein
MIGLLYAVYFYAVGGGKLDRDYVKAPLTAKLILIPGMILLWIYLIFKRNEN